MVTSRLLLIAGGAGTVLLFAVGLGVETMNALGAAGCAALALLGAADLIAQRK